METKEPLEIKDRRTQTIAADREALTGTEEPLSIEEAPDMFPRGTLEEVERVYADPIPISGPVRRQARACGPFPGRRPDSTAIPMARIPRLPGSSARQRALKI